MHNVVLSNSRRQPYMACSLIVCRCRCVTYANCFAGYVVAHFLQVDSVDGSFCFLLPPQAPCRELLNQKEDYFHIHTKHTHTRIWSTGSRKPSALLSFSFSFFRSQIISATVVEWRAIGPFKRLAKRHASTSFRFHPSHV